MLVINEIVNLGWFATDRHLPMDKVCIYVFIPNATKETYNYETEDYNRVLSLAQLHSIAQTQTDNDAVRKARQQLTMLIYEDTDGDDQKDFTFIIDDATDYHTLADFRSSEARKLFQEWQERTAQYKRGMKRLEAKRMEYADASLSQKQQMAAEIKAQEQKLEDEAMQLIRLEKEIRKIEYKELNK